MCAGYSGKPLAAKLGIKPGFVVAVVRPPRDYRQLLGPMPGKVVILGRLAGSVDLVHAFVTKRGDLHAQFESWKRAIRTGGCVWVSWPKKTSRVATDLTESVVRSIALSHGLVDVKVVKVDDTWSGLKFVFRLRDRV